MKVQRINTINISNNINKSLSKCNIQSEQKSGIVSFGKDISKPPEGLKKLFNKLFPIHACSNPDENIVVRTLEEYKSEFIKNYVKDALSIYHTLIREGERRHKELDLILEEGRKTNYETSVLNVGNNEGRNATFGVVNKETGLPEKILIWDKGSPICEYEIRGISPIKYSLTSLEYETSVVCNGQGKKIISYEETDNDTNDTIKIFMLGNGFKYFHGRKINNNEDPDASYISVLDQLTFNFKDIHKCCYAEKRSNGIAYFSYNTENNIWELQ